MRGESVYPKLASLAAIDGLHDGIHTVKVHIYFFHIFPLWYEKFVNGEAEIEIEHFERTQSHFAFHFAVKVLPNDILHHLFAVDMLETDVFILLHQDILAI